MDRNKSFLFIFSNKQYKKMIVIIYKHIIKNMLHISTNINKEKRYMYNYVKNIGLAHYGIIYGGLVRDEIIATHYRELFDKHVKEIKDENAYKNYWNASYHPESNKRMTIPKDIDIYFQTPEKSIAFISALNSFVKSYNGTINVVNAGKISELCYTLNHNFQHKKIRLIFYIGRTFSYAGCKITLNLDVIINNNSDSIIEPPFNNVDFTCNLLIMVKSANLNKYDIRLSRNTGTPLDTMIYTQKRRMELRLIENMLIGNIEFIRNVDSINCEYINGLRIIKMLKVHPEFKITNLLFEEITSDDIDFKVQDCDICLHSINESTDNKFIKIKTNKHSINIMHRSCFLKYLETEVYKKYTNTETNEIECKCTRRNLFNFKNSYKYSSLFEEL